MFAIIYIHGIYFSDLGWQAHDPVVYKQICEQKNNNESLLELHLTNFGYQTKSTATRSMLPPVLLGSLPLTPGAETGTLPC